MEITNVCLHLFAIYCYIYKDFWC